MRRRHALVCTAVLVAAGCGAGAAPEDYETVVEQLFGEQLAVRSGGSFGLENLKVLESEGPAPPALQVTFRKDTASSTVTGSDGRRGGAQAYLPLEGGPVEELHLRYLVRFPEDFNFVKGGKLPGLYGGSRTSGGRIPDGTNGFSTRYMWRADGDGEVYAYLPTSQQHGTSLGRGDWTWPTGAWTCVEQSVELNTPGTSDGRLRVWIDDRPVLEQTSLTFRTSEDLLVDGVFFSTFFGGDDPSWATPEDQQVQFAAFEVDDRKIGCP